MDGLHAPPVVWALAPFSAALHASCEHLKGVGAKGVVGKRDCNCF